MPIVYVKPREGGRIRMPDRNFTVMPATGMLVERDMFYERLIISGDLAVCEPPAKAPAPAQAPAKDAPKKGLIDSD
jgi:hypothetical protein